MWNLFKKREVELETGIYYKVSGDNVQIKALGGGEFNIECLGNVVRFNMHAMLAQEYVKRFMVPQIGESEPLSLKSDKELRDLLREMELEEDWESCSKIKKILDIRDEKKKEG